MRIIIIRSNITLLLFLVASHSIAQTGVVKTISKNYTNLTLREALQDVCLQFDVNLYFNTDETGDMVGNWEIVDQGLEDAIEKLLSNSKLGFINYRDFAIIIADNGLINQNYSSGFYKMLEDRLALDRQDQSVPGNNVVMGDAKQVKGDIPVKITGNIMDKETSEAVIGATLFIEELKKGTSSNEEGEFLLEVPIGMHTLIVKYVGYDDLDLKLSVFSDDQLNLTLSKEAITLDEIVIQSRAADQNINEIRSGVEQLNVKTIKQLPTFMGEVDVIKSILFLPGVSSVGEGSGGFNVRGGNVDQNLILQDESFIFNASHALGFFSTFNADLINGVTLYKGSIPAQYGGRLSSVLEVEMRDGSYDQFKAKGGMGVVSSRLAIEGPLVKDKTSFIFGARTTYSDWLLNLINVPEIKESSNSFYDINARITHNFSEKAKLVISGYNSNDQLTFADQFGFDYSTSFVQANLKNEFSPKLSSSLSAVYNNYQSKLLNFEIHEEFELENGIQYFKIKEALEYRYSKSLRFDFGGSFINYTLAPGTIIPQSSSSLVEPIDLDDQFAREMNVFVDAELKLGSKTAISGGLRGTIFQNIGPGIVNNYSDNELPSVFNYLQSENVGDGELIKSYTTLEPRLSFKLGLNQESSFKVGYSRTNQFLHQISNTASATPIDIWQVSNKFNGPQSSNNFSIGYFKNWKNNTWETSIETYFRKIDNLLEYKDFAQLLANDRLETDLITGIGRAYGVELSIRKRIGAFSGWLSYTYSRTERRVANGGAENTISNGEWYPSNFDKPNDLSVVTNIVLNKRHSFSFNFNYSTGRPTSGPIGKFNVGNVRNIPVYSSRNALRIPDYQRLDIAYTLSPALRVDRKWKGTWTLSIYNFLGRRNAYSVYYTQAPFGNVTANKLSILGSAFPSITYNFSLNQ